MTDNQQSLIRWVDELPPRPYGSKNTDRVRFVEELKQNPGRWAIYQPDAPNGQGAGCAHEFKRAFPGVEATGRIIRGTKPKRFTIYVRWVGP